MTISTREQLKTHIHAIHDYLRNSGAGYGMTAMKIFTFLYGLKIIEPLISKPDFKIKIDTELCKFSNLTKHFNKSEFEDVDPTLTISSHINNILKAIELEPKLKRYLHYQIPNNIKNNIWKKLIEMVNEIPLNNNLNEINDFSGKIYQYFIDRELLAMSDLGAYFTDRHITNYIIDKLKLTLKQDATIKEMIDPFGGSGGFTLGYLEWLNKFKVDWQKTNKIGVCNYQKINHFDMNDDVIKIAGLEFFTFTNKFPETNKFRCLNTFKHEFTKKYGVILTNPPYGGDKNEKSTEVLDNEKIISHIKNVLNKLNEEYKQKSIYQEILNEINIVVKPNITDYTVEEFELILDILINTDAYDLFELVSDTESIMIQLQYLKNQNIKFEKEQRNRQVNYETCSNFLRKYIDDNKIINCNDKEACSLVLLMALLENNGMCAGVLKEGEQQLKKYVQQQMVKIIIL